MLKSHSQEPQLFILLLLASFASVSAVLYTPALPAMAESLKITNAQAQISMTAFLIGYAFGNLPYGPFSNRYGRKPAIYVGILIAIIGTLLILLAGALHSFLVLVIGRFIAALGSSVGLKITFTMIGDVYSQTKATKKISYVMLSFAIAPGLAIALGGLITNQFGWESCFYFLTVYSALLLLLSIRLPETGQEKDLEALNGTKIVTGLLKKLKNRDLVTCAIIMGCATSFVYLFASEAPFVGINHIGLRADTYGLLNFIPPVGMIIGSFFAHQLAGKKNILTIMVMGIGIALLGSIVMFISFLGGTINIWSLFIPMPFIYIGLSLIFSNASGLAMTGAKNKSNASAVMNFINMGTSVLALTTIESLPSHKVYVLPLFFLFLGCLMLILRFTFLRQVTA